jgi:hypothetical protein
MVGLISVSPPRTPSIPSYATSAGFNKITFFEDFRSTGTIDVNNTKAAGFNFYTGTFPFKGNILTPTPQSDYSVSNSLLKVATNGNPGLGGYQFGSRVYLGTSAPRSIGLPTLAPGGYFEMRMALDAAIVSTGPAWWLQDLVGTLALADNDGSATGPFGEVDIVEWFNGTLTNNVIQWNADHALGTVQNPNQGQTGLAQDSNFHTYGLVWKTVAQGGGTGSFEFYFDGVLKSGTTLTYNTSSPFFTHDSGNYIMFLDTAPGKLFQVDYLFVVQS